MSIHSVSENSAGQSGGAAASARQHLERLDNSERGSERSPELHLRSLVRAVEGEIVPRLLLARRSISRPSQFSTSAAGVESGDADQLARLLLSENFEMARVFVESMQERGVGQTDLCLRLLAPAARALGLMWDRDECEFLQVAIGLGRLQQLLKRVSLLTPQTQRPDSRGHGRRAFIATVPGEQHSFGVVMVSHFFRQNGWDVSNEFPASQRDLASCVRRESFAVVGLSAGSDVRLDALTAAVRTVRRFSHNAAVGIIVGGPLLQSHPELALRVGADAAAEDGEQAARLAESVCALLAGDR